MKFALLSCCIVAAFFVSAGSGSEIPRVEHNRWASGVAQPPPGPITVMAASGKQLYVGGEFTSVNGVACRRVARWNGTAWFPMGGGVQGIVGAIAVSGSNVYVAGALTKAFQTDGSSISVSNIARWNGIRWSGMAGGTDGNIVDLCVVGTNLYAGGAFKRAGGILSPGVACWNGRGWAGISTNSNPGVNTLATDGRNLFVAGYDFSGGVWTYTVARWDGTNWFPLQPLGAISDLAWHQGELYAAGQFWVSNQWNTVVKWDGTAWFPVGGGLRGVGTSQRIVSSGHTLYVLDPPYYRDSIFRWDECGWTVLPDFLVDVSSGGRAQAITIYEDRLLVGGRFGSIAGHSVKWLARWRAGDWPRLTASTEPAAEGTATNGLLTVRLSFCSEPAEPLRIQFETRNETAVAGKDYQAVSGAITANPGGAAEYLIKVPLIADRIYESNKTFRILLSSPDRVILMQTQVVCTITDDEPLPELSVSDVEGFERNTGTNRFNFIVSLSGAVETPFEVHCDFQFGSQANSDDVQMYFDPLMIPAGTTNVIFPVEVYGDRFRESNEVFCINCWSWYGHEFVKPTGCGTILDDDVFPRLSISPFFGPPEWLFTFFEGDQSQTQNIRLYLSVPFTNEVSFSYSTSDRTARSGEDYLLPAGRAVIPPGNTFHDLPVVILGEPWKEPFEHFTVNLTTPTNLLLAQTQIVCMIWNDDRYSLPRGFAVSTIVTNLHMATAFDIAPDGRIFLCEQRGRVLLIRDGVLAAKPFLSITNVTTEDDSEAGLLGITLDPGFQTNGFFYVYHTVRTNWSAPLWNRISRFTAGPDEAIAGSEVVLMDIDRLSRSQIHHGGGIQFGPDGMLYIGVGENGTGANAQSLTNLLGKILRIAPDGSIPADNPFFNSLSGARRAIWAYGLRNPFRFAFQPGSGRMLINDVGEQTWEEINDGRSGANYGWPVTEGGSTDARFVNPIFVYRHTDDETNGCSILAGAFYNPARPNFPGQYLGSYFFGDFCRGWIRQLTFTNGVAVHPFVDGLPGPVDLKVAPDGSLYCLSRTPSYYGGALFRIFVPQGESRFESIRRTANDTVHARFTAPEGTRFELQASSDLQTWQSATCGVAQASPLEISLPATNRPATFYRLSHDYLLNK